MADLPGRGGADLLGKIGRIPKYQLGVRRVRICRGDWWMCFGKEGRNYCYWEEGGGVDLLGGGLVDLLRREGRRCYG